MAAYQEALRKYGPSVDQVVATLTEARALVSSVDDSEELLRKAKEHLEEAEEHLDECARALSTARAEVAPQFAREVTDQLSRLEMASSELLCDVRTLPRDKWTADGPDAVEFLFKPAGGMEGRPLARIASGGELSRVMLALKVVLGSLDQVDTLVFDEIDAGVGGATARALADVLSDLAQTHQVIVITHLAQVAVCADKHYVVEKGGEPIETILKEVSGAQRTEEIARMLSGEISPESLAHAEALLKS